MNKQDLIDKVATKSGLTKADAGRALDAVTDSVKEELSGGGSVSLVGFGTFGISNRKARSGRNPQTGETIQIAARKAVKFKAGKALKDAVQ